MVTKPRKSSLYNYRVIYPKEMESTCAKCGCKIKIVAYDIQQTKAKHYCQNPCRSNRMSPVKLVWSENWGDSKKLKLSVSRETYLELLRKHFGIREEGDDRY